MPPPPAGSPAPAVDGIDFSTGPTALFFYKVTCPVCQMAAPKMETFETAYPGRIRGIGQDPRPKLDEFEHSYGLTFGSQAEPPPYPVSQAYGIRVVPTIVLVEAGGTVEAVAESWDRDAVNDVSRRLAKQLGAPFVPISLEGDGLPAFRPG
jgi:thiol-disulfide isomerase/thioredoxin